MHRFDAFRFALAGGIYGAGFVALVTILTLFDVPGFKSVTDLLEQFYGFYGYSVSAGGAGIGAIWGFIDGFFNLGIFALLYNMLLGKRKSA